MAGAAALRSIAASIAAGQRRQAWPDRAAARRRGGISPRAAGGSPSRSARRWPRDRRGRSRSTRSRPALRRSLWHPAQYRLTSPWCAATGAGGGVCASATPRQRDEHQARRYVSLHPCSRVVRSVGPFARLVQHCCDEDVPAGVKAPAGSVTFVAARVPSPGPEPRRLELEPEPQLHHARIQRRR